MYQLKEEDLLHIPNLEFLAKQVVEGFITGLHKSPYHGFSVEFAEHRQYNPGENIRHIDWKLFARTEKLFVKRYEEETNLRCQLVIDHSSSMYTPLEGLSKIRFSAVAAASLMLLLKKQRDATGLSLMSSTLDLHLPAKVNSLHHKRMMFELNQLLQVPKETRQSSLSANLHLLAENLHKRSLVIIFSDLMETNSDKLAQALQHLRFNKHEVILFWVTDQRTEVDFEFSHRPYVFIDSESGERLKLHPQSIKSSYQEQVKAFQMALQVTCLQQRVSLFEASVGTDFNQLLLQFMTKRENFT